MATAQQIRTAAALVLAALVVPAAAQAGPLASGARTLPAPAYAWPVKPFDRQHPVRAFLDDPRIGKRGGRAFHFGIDVAAPDGTPVYAVEGGTVHRESPRSLAVETGGRHEFGYWHIVPAVAHRQVDARHQLHGWIAAGWGHVHFAERRNGVYLNPLRPGGLGPYVDPVAPTVTRISLARGRDGALAVRADAHDTTWPRVPGPWADEPVTPALLRWRVVRDGRPGRWQTAVDFRERMLDAHDFATVYAPATTQNHKGIPGPFRFSLSQAWTPADGTYRIEVAASDTRGNRSVAHLDVTVRDGAARF